MGAKKAAIACDVPGEVRELLFSTRLGERNGIVLRSPTSRKHIVVTLERVSKTCFGPGHDLSRAEKCRNHKGF